MSSRAGAGPARSPGHSSLAHRLRRDTAALHAEVEEVADLPGSVGSRADYRDLLEGFEGAWVALSAVAVDAAWTSHWTTLGVRPAGAGQLDLIRADLGRLGSAPTGRSVPVSRGRAQQFRAHQFRAHQFRATRARAKRARADEQLGQLYVLEGSALGRRVLAPSLVAKLGDIPVSFFLDDERHPHGWRAVQSALRTLDDDQDRQDDVVRGANNAFATFLSHLRHRSTAAGLSVG